MKRILFLSSSNKLPNRLITIAEHFQKGADIALINWQRNPDVPNNFENLPYTNIQTTPTLKGLLSFYRQSRNIIANLDFDLAYCCDYRMLLLLLS